MNPPEINVTPGSVAVPAGPPAAGRGRPVVARRANLRPVIGVVVLLLVLLIGYKLFHHRNHNEATADAITRAIINNNMTPVEHAFNALYRPQLEDRVRVARLSQMTASLGEFKGSKEITPSGADYHEFTETFANGTLDEKIKYDADGKIARFYIGPQASSTSAP